MTANGNSRPVSVVGALAVVLMCHLAGDVLLGNEPALRLRASATGGSVNAGSWTVELFRWSTEAERAPLVGALAAPTPGPPAAAGAAADAAGRGPATAPGAGGRAGRGGRGGRGAAAPPNPLARLTAAVRAAPTVGFVWGDGVTGYSIKYAWRAVSTTGGHERIVLVTDRRLGGNEPAPSAGTASAPMVDAEFTLIEMRIDSTGAGEGKTSLTTTIVVDAAAQTIALDSYQAAPVMLKVRR